MIAAATATATTSDCSRAEALTRLAPYLPESDQPAILAQALAASTAFGDDPPSRPGASWAGTGPASGPVWLRPPGSGMRALSDVAIRCGLGNCE
jgi:hypothetical protein